MSYSLPIPKTTLTTVYAVKFQNEGDDLANDFIFVFHISYETLTTLSQLDVAKTGAMHGPSEVIPFIEHTSSILFYYC